MNTSNWIEPQDRLPPLQPWDTPPENRVNYLVVLERNPKQIITRWHNAKIGAPDKSEWYGMHAVIAWQELPELPDQTPERKERQCPNK